MTIQPLSPELAKAFAVTQPEGALVSSVAESSPAAQAGVRHGDVILEYDGQKIKRTPELSRMVAATPAGKKVTLKVLRDGKELSLPLTIARLTEKGEEAVASATADATKRSRLGVVVEPLTPETARGLGAGDRHGVIVRSVQEGSPADLAGIRSGDVITEVNRQPMKSVEDLRRAVEQHQAGSALLLLVTREGSARYLTVKV